MLVCETCGPEQFKMLKYRNILVSIAPRLCCKKICQLPVSNIPFAPNDKTLGGGNGAEGLTVGQTIAGACGGGGGGGGNVWALEPISASRVGPEKVELVLGVAQMAWALLINHCPDDASVFDLQ